MNVKVQRSIEWSIILLSTIVFSLGVSLPLLTLESRLPSDLPVYYKKSIIGTLSELSNKKLWIPFALVLFFSFILPIIKMSCSFLTAYYHSKSMKIPKILFLDVIQFLRFISKYQFVDIFVILILHTLLNGGMVKSNLNIGFIFFSLYCYISIISAQILDIYRVDNSEAGNESNYVSHNSVVPSQENLNGIKTDKQNCCHNLAHLLIQSFLFIITLLCIIGLFIYPIVSLRMSAAGFLLEETVMNLTIMARVQSDLISPVLFAFFIFIPVVLIPLVTPFSHFFSKVMPISLLSNILGKYICDWAMLDVFCLAILVAMLAAQSFTGISINFPGGPFIKNGAFLLLVGSTSSFQFGDLFNGNAANTKGFNYKERIPADQPANYNNNEQEDNIHNVLSESDTLHPLNNSIHQSNLEISSNNSQDETTHMDVGRASEHDVVTSTSAPPCTTANIQNVPHQEAKGSNRNFLSWTWVWELLIKLLIFLSFLLWPLLDKTRGSQQVAPRLNLSQSPRTLSDLLLTSLPASVGSCNATMDPTEFAEGYVSSPPTPCAGGASPINKFTHDIVEGELRWISGLRSINITGLTFQPLTGSNKEKETDEQDALDTSASNVSSPLNGSSEVTTDHSLKPKMRLPQLGNEFMSSANLMAMVMDGIWKDPEIELVLRVMGLPLGGRNKSMGGDKKFSVVVAFTCMHERPFIKDVHLKSIKFLGEEEINLYVDVNLMGIDQLRASIRPLAEYQSVKNLRQFFEGETGIIPVANTDLMLRRRQWEGVYASHLGQYEANSTALILARPKLLLTIPDIIQHLIASAIPFNQRLICPFTASSYGTVLSEAQIEERMGENQNSTVVLWNGSQELFSFKADEI